jgi:hypothetical protein
MAVGRRAAHLVLVLDRKKGERSELPRYFSQRVNFALLPESFIIPWHLLEVFESFRKNDESCLKQGGHCDATEMPCVVCG